MRSLLLAACLVVIGPLSACAQDMPPEARARADSLRATAECPIEVSWPVLPPPEGVAASFAPDGRQVSGTASQIQVPQYALLYDPGSGRCRPVIVTTAETWGARWRAVDPRPGEVETGEAPLPYFDFLGREIPDRVPVTRSEPRTSKPVQAPAHQPGELPPDSVVEFLLASAATDLHEHQPPDPVRFREVHVGHVLTRDGQAQYMLCGQFLPAQKQGEAEWTSFATIKTSGYEQWIGAQAAGICEDPSVIRDEAGDLSASLQSRLDSLR